MTGAITPLDLRGDLVALPALITRTRAVWFPTLIVAIAGVALLIPALRANSIIALVVSVLVFPPPIAGPFLAGILAPRAGWLAGLIVGVVAGIFYSIAIATVQDLGAADRAQIVVSTIVFSPVFGAFIGAFGAFYKRFLRLSNPNLSGGGRRPANRPANRPGPRSARPAARRR